MDGIAGREIRIGYTDRRAFIWGSRITGTAYSGRREACVRELCGGMLDVVAQDGATQSLGLGDRAGCTRDWLPRMTAPIDLAHGRFHNTGHGGSGTGLSELADITNLTPDCNCESEAAAPGALAYTSGLTCGPGVESQPQRTLELAEFGSDLNTAPTPMSTWPRKHPAMELRTQLVLPSPTASVHWAPSPLTLQVGVANSKASHPSCEAA
eukprot:scaffold67728_cov28-Tisochrysis_lutea.AAC.3